MISSSSQKSFFSKPGLAIKTTSHPSLIFGNFMFTVALSLLFILFLKTAFFETFLETINPKRLSSKLFFTNLNDKKFSLNFFPFLNALSKSFLFLRQLFFSNTAVKDVKYIKSCAFINFLLFRF